MTREIKFRAFDKKSGKVLPVKAIYWSFSPRNDEEIIGCRLLNEEIIEECTSDIILMQYTGLKDKNGKEIYEGDIVDTGEWHGKSEVFFMNGSYKIKGRSSSVGFGQMSKKSEVIGNIYENPELLKTNQ